MVVEPVCVVHHEQRPTLAAELKQPAEDQAGNKCGMQIGRIRWNERSERGIGNRPTGGGRQQFDNRGLLNADHVGDRSGKRGLAHTGVAGDHGAIAESNAAERSISFLLAANQLHRDRLSR